MSLLVGDTVTVSAESTCAAVAGRTCRVVATESDPLRFLGGVLEVGTGRIAVEPIDCTAQTIGWIVEVGEVAIATQ